MPEGSEFLRPSDEPLKIGFYNGNAEIINYCKHL